MDKIIDLNSESHYTIIDNYILGNARLNSLEQIVYIHLKRYSIEKDRCFPGINVLAENLISSANTIRKALKSLKDKGFIDIQQRYNNSNVYSLLLYPEYKQEIKNHEKECKNIADVFKVYQNNINPVYGSIEREKLISWFETFDGNGDIVILAINAAVSQGVRKIRYIDSILLNWHQCGIRTVDQCEAYQKNWDKKRGENNSNRRDSSQDKERDKGDQYDFSEYGDV